MDLDFLNDVKQNSHHFQKDLAVNEARQCPKCDNYIIEDDNCQACGYNLSFKLLGEPLGEKSFYTVRENYWDSLSVLERENFKFFKDEVKFKHYLNKVKLRYNDLLDFFYSQESLQDENRALYLHELRDLVVELMSYEIDEKEIWTPLNEKQGDINSGTISLYEQIKSVVTQEKAQRREERKKTLLNYKLAGKMSVSTIFMTLLLMILGISISLAYFSYQNVLNFN
jgi:hypothetical protein